jgi:hypothetical protein
VDEYADKQIERLRKQVARNKAILEGRGAAGGLPQSAVQAAQDLVVDEINDFLTGE